MMKVTIEYQGVEIEPVRAERMIRKILIEESKFIKSKSRASRQKMVKTLCEVIEEEERCF